LRTDRLLIPLLASSSRIALIVAVREALTEIVEKDPLWDGRFWNLQVTDARERTLELRVLATSADASKSFDLRCAIRESSSPTCKGRRRNGCRGNAWPSWSDHDRTRNAGFQPSSLAALRDVR
jgi:hypothetical protein